jgi:hypothetical protein
VVPTQSVSDEQVCVQSGSPPVAQRGGPSARSKQKMGSGVGSPLGSHVSGQTSAHAGGCGGFGQRFLHFFLRFFLAPAGVGGPGRPPARRRRGPPANRGGRRWPPPAARRQRGCDRSWACLSRTGRTGPPRPGVGLRCARRAARDRAGRCRERRSAGGGYGPRGRRRAAAGFPFAPRRDWGALIAPAGVARAPPAARWRP